MSLFAPKAGSQIDSEHLYFAFGDVQGCAETLNKALPQANTLARKHIARGGKVTFVFMGDYEDRGPDTKSVLDTLVQEKAKSDGIERVFLMGNHDFEFYHFIANPNPRLAYTHFRQMVLDGGLQTFASYEAYLNHEDVSKILPKERWSLQNMRWSPEMARKIKSQILETMPTAHIAFLKDLQPKFETEHMLFCHGGVDPSVPLALQDIRVLTGMDDGMASKEQRSPSRRFRSYEGGPIEGKTIVYGHSVTTPSEIERLAKKGSGRIPTDTGACMGGHLTFVILNAEGKLVNVHSTRAVEPAYNASAFPMRPAEQSDEAAITQEWPSTMAMGPR